MRITEETITDLFAEGALRPVEFELSSVEVRYYGSCHPSAGSPCQHVEGETSDLWRVTYPDGHQSNDPQACPNLWQTNDHGPEGIGGAYLSGGTFTYLSDDPLICAAVYERAAEVITRTTMCATCGYEATGTAARDVDPRDETAPSTPQRPLRHRPGASERQAAMTKFTVTVLRTERIAFTLDATDADDARERYLHDGDESSSETTDTTIESVTIEPA